MKGHNVSFKKVYLIYLIVLVIAMISAILYVRSLLQQYEDMRPEVCVEEAIAQLAEDAVDESFFTKYGLSEISKGKFEEQIDVKKEYLALFVSDDLKYSSVNEKAEEDVLYYTVEKDGNAIAEVKLKRPVCVDSGSRIAISRRFDSRWRLIGTGIISY